MALGWTTVDSCCDPIDSNSHSEALFDESTAQAGADIFKVLADPVRLRLLNLIASRPNREVCACDLVDVLDRSQPTVSHHLKVLHDAGILTRERRGTWIHYGLADGAVEQIDAATRRVFAISVAV